MSFRVVYGFSTRMPNHALQRIRAPLCARRLFLVHCFPFRSTSASARIAELGSLDEKDHMKVFPWLLTLALAIVCFTCWALSSLIMQSLADIGREPLPAVTVLVLRPNGWILFFPIPWIIYSAVLSFRRDITPGTLFVFAGTMVLAAAALVCALIIACVVPWITLKVALSK
jgi:hypothetical protein